MRLGRVIQLETQKGQLTQYQRNASYAKEYLDAGHLNLDKLRELNQRGRKLLELQDRVSMALPWRLMVTN